jgi:diadenosine tetraphosphate (Ap4A) HIT family hydrolase
MPHVPTSSPCELCALTDVVLENSLAYVRFDSNALSRGHLLVVPKRHVASFFEMSPDEQSAVLQLLGEAQRHAQLKFAPDGYNIGVNVGVAAGQSRMHVHVHLIPRYVGDVPNPAGGIRCVLAPGNRTASQEPTSN